MLQFIDSHPFNEMFIMPPPRRRGALSGHRRPSSVRPSVCLSVCLSDVAYIGSNSKTKRPRKTKLCTGVPQVTCDSHTDFKVKRSKVKVSRGGAYCGGHLAAQLVYNGKSHSCNDTFTVDLFILLLAKNT